MYVGLKSHTSSVETKKLEKTEKTGVEEKSVKIQKNERNSGGWTAPGSLRFNLWQTSASLD